MKFLIYLVVFLVYAILKPFIDDASYAFASSLTYDADGVALITGALVGISAALTYACGFQLCKVWDRHRESKASVEYPAETPAFTAKHSKARYCKLCGGPIDPQTRKCTGCKKQYFRPPVFGDKHLFIASTAVLCAVVVLLLFLFVNQRSKYEAQIQELNAQVSELKVSNNEHVDTINDLQRELAGQENIIESKDERIDNLNEEIEFYDRNVVIIFDDGSGIYHKYDTFCTLFINSDFWIYNTEAAKSRGYEPCPTCCD